MYSAPIAGTLSRCKIGSKKCRSKKECKSFTLFLLALQTIRNFALLKHIAE